MATNLDKVREETPNHTCAKCLKRIEWAGAKECACPDGPTPGRVLADWRHFDELVNG